MVVIEYHLLLLLLDTLYFTFRFVVYMVGRIILGCWLAHGRGRSVGHLWPVHCVVSLRGWVGYYEYCISRSDDEASRLLT